MFYFIKIGQEWLQKSWQRKSQLWEINNTLPSGADKLLSIAVKHKDGNGTSCWHDLWVDRIRQDKKIKVHSKTTNNL